MVEERDVRERGGLTRAIGSSLQTLRDRPREDLAEKAEIKEWLGGAGAENTEGPLGTIINNLSSPYTW